MRVGQINKNAEAVRGRQIKRAPFNRSGYEWHPAEGEVYGFMTSGMARFDLENNNVRERSNVTLYRWGVGPTNNVNFEEVARRADGFPVGTGGETAVPTPTSTPDEPEICVEPTVPGPENNTHIYNGSADGEIVVSGAVNGRQTYDEAIGITVKDDRSISIALDGDEAFLTSTVPLTAVTQGYIPVPCFPAVTSTSPLLVLSMGMRQLAPQRLTRLVPALPLS
jgi:hypothetical protein